MMGLAAAVDAARHAVRRRAVHRAVGLGDVFGLLEDLVRSQHGRLTVAAEDAIDLLTLTEAWRGPPVPLPAGYVRAHGACWRAAGAR